MPTEQAPARNRSFRSATWTIWALIGFPWGIHAESLTDAWQMCIGANGALAAARSDREAAEADHSAAMRQRWPAPDVTGAYMQFDHAPILDIMTPTGQLQAPIWKRDGYATARADLSVPLWTSGRISAAIGAAAASARGAGAQDARSSAELKLAVADSYIRRVSISQVAAGSRVQCGQPQSAC